MSIELVKNSVDQSTISVGESLDVNCVESFRHAYEAAGTPKQLCIDFRDTSFIDSSALGMLINMKKYFGNNCPEIKLINCGEYITKILMISRLDKMFVIE